MEPMEVQSIRDELVLKRERLDRAVRHGHGSSELRDLLERVDAALLRIDDGRYGLCLVCDEPVEEDRLRQDPLVCFCLDHLSDDERRRLEGDIERAVRVQSLLLPQHELRAAGWLCHFRSIPAGPVSGDYCEIGEEGGGVEIALGDASGKGIAGSLLATHVSALFRAIGRPGVSVSETVANVNRMMCCGSLAPHYATAVYARAMPDGEIELCNAGHCPPALVRGTAVDLLPPHGLPLGMFPGAPYGSTRIRLERGDALVLYTDGLIEAEDGRGTMFGAERLSDLLASASRRPGDGLLRACFEDPGGFRDGTPGDDTTVVVVRRVGD